MFQLLRFQKKFDITAKLLNLTKQCQCCADLHGKLMQDMVMWGWIRKQIPREVM